MSSDEFEFNPLTDDDKELFNSVSYFYSLKYETHFIYSIKNQSIFEFMKHFHQYPLITF